MRSQTSYVRPPRFSTWLLELFSLDEESDVIQGDLLEEFSELALKSGVKSACRWYWRQSIKSAAHLAIARFSTKPMSLALAVAGGLLLLFWGSDLPERTVVAVLDFRVPPHFTPFYTWSQVQTRIFWLVYGPLVGRLIMSLFIGLIVALAARKREIVATMTLSFVQAVLASIPLLFWPGKLGYSFLPLQLGVSIMILLGGIVVREFRAGMSCRPLGS
jgi:hypothetical protein